MMPEFFSQTETNTGAVEAKKVKNTLFVSYAIKTISLIFIVLSAIFSFYYLFGFAVLFLIGVAIKQSTLERIASFEYFLVRNELIVSAFTNFGAKKYTVKIPLKNVLEFESVSEIKLSKNDIFAAPDGKSIMKIRFNDNSLTRNLYFSPSLYLEALIRERKNDLL